MRSEAFFIDDNRHGNADADHVGADADMANTDDCDDYGSLVDRHVRRASCQTNSTQVLLMLLLQCLRRCYCCGCSCVSILIDASPAVVAEAVQQPPAVVAAQQPPTVVAVAVQQPFFQQLLWALVAEAVQQPWAVVAAAVQRPRLVRR